MSKILNIGSLNLDYVYAVPHFVEAGETLLAGRRDVFAGGKGLNQTVAAARAGAKVFHGGAVLGDKRCGRHGTNAVGNGLYPRDPVFKRNLSVCGGD